MGASLVTTLQGHRLSRHRGVFQLLSQGVHTPRHCGEGPKDTHTHTHTHTLPQMTMVIILPASTWLPGAIQLFGSRRTAMTPPGGGEGGGMEGRRETDDRTQGWQAGRDGGQRGRCEGQGRVFLHCMGISGTGNDDKVITHPPILN